jgi:hypothetical protein
MNSIYRLSWNSESQNSWKISVSSMSNTSSGRMSGNEILLPNNGSANDWSWDNV